MQRSGEPVLNEIQARPTIHIYPITTLTGDNLNRNANKLYVMPKGDKSRQKRDDIEYPTWLRSVHSSPREIMTLTWRRDAVDVYHYQS